MDAIGRVIRAYCQKFEDDFWDAIFWTGVAAVIFAAILGVGWFLLAILLDWTNVRKLPDAPMIQVTCQEKVELTGNRVDCGTGARAIPFERNGTSYTKCECPRTLSSAPATEVAAPSASSVASPAPLPPP